MSERHNELLEEFKDNKRYVQFLEDMRDAGISVRDYSGRGMYGETCPAATTSDEFSEQDIYAATKVKLRIDNMGRRYVLYP